jgi:predicted dithiol-disulfide oxidoreductase (DUF899 family)
VTAAGFTVARNPNGSLQATRGSMGKTLLLGAMAGKNFHVTFTVEFYGDEQGNLIARLNRNVSGGALKGGAIGANMTNNAFVDTGTSLTGAFTAQGILLNTISHG